MTYWSRGYRDFTLEDDRKLAYAEKGLAAVETALSMRPEDVDALIYKGLLLRLKATVVRDAGLRRALIEEAEATKQLALELRRKAASELTGP
jgi:hypothetical protein